ncbi:collagen alpha-1(I) chain-like [Sarcophilus harrisii]|uniref:collagen alpha-1(I) chain-like n=1 Tax=Sarcophilus harrisii TaxID=9305 RepID=UPI0013020A62|nr:collagen alpha-1(I) chain-like [Sarcophilus harrisii]
MAYTVLAASGADAAAGEQSLCSRLGFRRLAGGSLRSRVRAEEAAPRRGPDARSPGSPGCWGAPDAGEPRTLGSLGPRGPGLGASDARGPRMLGSLGPSGARPGSLGRSGAPDAREPREPRTLGSPGPSGARPGSLGPWGAPDPRGPRPPVSPPAAALRKASLAARKMWGRGIEGENLELEVLQTNGPYTCPGDKSTRSQRRARCGDSASAGRTPQPLGRSLTLGRPPASDARDGPACRGGVTGQPEGPHPDPRLPPPQTSRLSPGAHRPLPRKEQEAAGGGEARVKIWAPGAPALATSHAGIPAAASLPGPALPRLGRGSEGSFSGPASRAGTQETLGAPWGTHGLLQVSSQPARQSRPPPQISPCGLFLPPSWHLSGRPTKGKLPEGAFSSRARAQVTASQEQLQLPEGAPTPGALSPKGVTGQGAVRHSGCTQAPVAPSAPGVPKHLLSIRQSQGGKIRGHGAGGHRGHPQPKDTQGLVRCNLCRRAPEPPSRPSRQLSLFGGPEQLFKQAGPYQSRWNELPASRDFKVVCERRQPACSREADLMLGAKAALLPERCPLPPLGPSGPPGTRGRQEGRTVAPLPKTEISTTAASRWALPDQEHGLSLGDLRGCAAQAMVQRQGDRRPAPPDPQLVPCAPSMCHVPGPCPCVLSLCPIPMPCPCATSMAVATVLASPSHYFKQEREARPPSGMEVEAIMGLLELTKNSFSDEPRMLLQPLLGASSEGDFLVLPEGPSGSGPSPPGQPPSASTPLLETTPELLTSLENTLSDPLPLGALRGQPLLFLNLGSSK